VSESRRKDTTGRQRHRREEKSKMDVMERGRVGYDWIDLTQDRDHGGLLWIW
jgi:hypothetical protein